MGCSPWGFKSPLRHHPDQRKRPKGQGFPSGAETHRMNEESLGETILQVLVLFVIIIVFGLMGMAAMDAHFVNPPAKHAEPAPVHATVGPKDHPKHADASP